MTRRPAEEIVDEYRQMLLRWNRQINLVSRRETAARVSELIEQSRAGCRAIHDHLVEDVEIAALGPGRLDYFDVGSGGGIPGFLWHVWLGDEGWTPVTRLVEPRQKRAWFLGRLAQLAGVRELSVLEGSWPRETVHGQRTGDRVLISLKALRMTDGEVLDGLPGGFEKSARRVTICRVFPPGKGWSEELRQELGVGAAGAPPAMVAAWQPGALTHLRLPG